MAEEVSEGVADFVESAFVRYAEAVRELTHVRWYGGDHYLKNGVDRCANGWGPALHALA